MNRANALMGLWSQTSIHAGVGQSTGVIDLPIQREGHTGWPCVFGSSVKGALRAAARSRLEGENRKLIPLIFGPDSTEESASEFAGALAVGDARLLLLPVRSLTSHFKWVTCPQVLTRLQRDAARLNIELSDFAVPEVDGDNDALTSEEDESKALYLEEYRFELKKEELDEIITVLVELMAKEETEKKAVMNALNKQLVIISDNSFANLSTYATPVNAHVRIKAQTKTVQPGALWYEETLPPETLLYAALSATESRSGDATQSAEIILGGITESLFHEHPYLQLGGNETVGMGWCRLTFNGGN